jgi:hypothetical protein
VVKIRPALHQERAHLAGFQLVCADGDIAEIAQGMLDRLSAGLLVRPERGSPL